MGLEAMSGAPLTGFHAQAVRLSALANSISTPEPEVERHPAYADHDAGADREQVHDASEADTAYKAKSEAFDAGADIWAMLSVIQRD
ncbi:MAG: hypothetical protein EOP18_07975 [Rhizobiaceae bacterium]|nr:MAG: hypothetical protein EOP18_07975 [Rhizobiaceae bacterium]